MSAGTGGRAPTLIVLASVAGAGALIVRAGDRAAPPGARAIELVETVRVRAPEGAKALDVWIPKPPTDAAQTAELVSVTAPGAYRVTSDGEFGNELVYLRGKPEPAPLEVTLRYRIVRRPQERAAGTAPGREDRTPRGLVVVSPEIREIARQQTRGLSTTMEKGRALYDYVLRRMSYDKSGEGWGRGDSVYACRVGKGNCTDFHSLFMALAMASGIPSRFRMGFSLPEAPEGAVLGYHCWAEFYDEALGWVPVDISEAWKHPARRDFYFGRLDGSRVLVSTGRELRLSPPQRGKPLNFLSRPYVEADGVPHHDVDFERRYRETRI